MREIIIKSEQTKFYCTNLIKQMPVDGSETVIVKKTPKDSTSKQRRLQWMWYGEVANSGIGSEDTKEGVHVRAKWQFARPILIRDDELYQIIYSQFREAITGSINYAEFCRDFAKRWISTQKMSTKQRAEYLTDFQRFWVSQGVDLTDPSLQGVDLNKYKHY